MLYGLNSTASFRKQYFCRFSLTIIKALSFNYQNFVYSLTSKTSMPYWTWNGVLRKMVAHWYKVLSDRNKDVSLVGAIYCVLYVNVAQSLMFSILKLFPVNSGLVRLETFKN